MSVCISLFDYTGNMLKPWAAAGHHCYAFDTQHKGFDLISPGITGVHMDLSTPDELLEWAHSRDIRFVSAFPPCDHLAVSGARWFKGKGLRSLQQAIGLFATAAEFCEWSDAPYMIENPVSTISTYWRKPDYTFHPWQYTSFGLGDNYTKKTCLWTGHGFVMPCPAIHQEAGEPDDRIHKCPPGSDRANIRSATPIGFAKAVYEANCLERDSGA